MTQAPVPTFRDRLVFDEQRGEILDQTRRYMLLRPEALMGLFRHLPDAARGEALEALRASIYEQGADSARAYRAHGNSDGAALLDTIARSAPQLGWGVWRFAMDEALIRLEVKNSPFAKGFGPSDAPVCHAIVGMLTAVSAMVMDRPTVVSETECAAMGAASCKFEMGPATS